jgi:hypothetical protein
VIARSDLANELLTTVLDGYGWRWTLTTAATSEGEVRRTALDPSGSAKPPEKRKVGGSTPPLTTSLTCTDVSLVIAKMQLMTLVVSFLGHQLQADDRTSMP